MDRTPPGESLPPSQDDIDISRADLETAADAAGHFGCDQARTRTEKPVTRSGLKGTRIASPSFRALRAPGRRTASRSDPITALGASRHALRSPTALRLPRQAPLRRGI